MGAWLLTAGLSRMASSMVLVAIVLHTLTRFGSAPLAGWTAVCAFAPGLIVSPLAGALLDRTGASRAIALDMALSFASRLGFVLADAAGYASPPVLLAATAIWSITSPLSTAGVRVLLPRLVPPDALPRANAIDTVLFAAAEIVGPALAGAISGLAGARIALLTAAILSLGACACAARMQRGETGARGRLLPEAARGLGLVLRDRSLRGLAVAYSAYQAAWGILLIALPVIVIRDLGPDSEGAIGAIWGLSGLAGGLGALLAGKWRVSGRERQIMAVCLLATAAALWPIGASFGVAGAAASAVSTGFLAGPIDVGLLTLRQRRAGPAVLGRVLAVSMSLNLAGLPIGSALGGWLSAWPPLAFAAAALACVLAAGALWGLIPGESRLAAPEA